MKQETDSTHAETVGIEHESGDPSLPDYKAYLDQEEARLKKLAADAEEDRLLWEEEKARQQKRRRKVIQKTLVTTALLGLGAIFLYSAYLGTTVQLFLSLHWQEIAGASFILVAFSYTWLPDVVLSPRFRDVDIRRRLGSPKPVVMDPKDVWPFPIGHRPDEDLDDSDNDEDTKRSNRDPFRMYFLSIKDVLEQKASDAEEKASLLLDKGTAYTIGGIVFFVISIIAWQVLSWIHGFKTEFIYGIASCSALFVFIEFLSAWFLKQYRHYVDTSTYLLKVKAIFDRYMLVYLASNSLAYSLTDAQQHRADMLIDMLAKDIKWPDSYLLKKADLSFANDAAAALTNLAKEIRGKDRNKKITSSR